VHLADDLTYTRVQLYGTYWWFISSYFRVINHTVKYGTVYSNQYDISYAV